MKSRTDIQRELELDNSSLPFDVHMPVFDLPEGYFENFAAAVLAKVKGETADTAFEELSVLSPLLAGVSKKTPYSLPDNYFNASLASGAIREQDPIPGWGVQGRNMPYTVPAGYFTQLPHSVLEGVRPARAKVVSMVARKWVQYAAAAVIIGVLVWGGMLYSGNKPLDPAAAPDVWVAKKLHNVSNQELEDFILSTSGAGTAEPVQQTASNGHDVSKMLRDVPNSELDAFLAQLPTGTEQIN